MVLEFIKAGFVVQNLIKLQKLKSFTVSQKKEFNQF